MLGICHAFFLKNPRCQSFSAASFSPFFSSLHLACFNFIFSRLPHASTLNAADLFAGLRRICELVLLSDNFATALVGVDIHKLPLLFSTLANTHTKNTKQKKKVQMSQSERNTKMLFVHKHNVRVEI